MNAPNRRFVAGCTPISNAGGGGVLGFRASDHPSGTMFCWVEGVLLRRDSEEWSNAMSRGPDRATLRRLVVVAAASAEVVVWVYMAASNVWWRTKWRARTSGRAEHVE